MTTQKHTPFTELFPVQVAALPALHAYSPPTRDDANARFAARMARTHGGRWAFVGNKLLTDTPAPKDAGLEKEKRYQPKPTALADYLIWALVPPLADNLYTALQTPLNGNFRVLQRPVLRSWVVNDAPAISIGIAHSLIYAQTLADYARTIPDVRGLVKMTVISRAPLFDYRLVQGFVADVVGTVKDHRTELERFATTKAALKRVGNAPDDEPVVQMMTPFGAYRYAASSLHITLTPKDYARLRVNAADANKAAYQDIGERARGVAAASAVLKAMDYIGDAFRADKQPKSFLGASNLSFSAQIMLGDRVPRPYAPRKLWAQLQKVGPFGVRDDVPPLRVGVLSGLGQQPPDGHADKLLDAARALGIPVADVQTVVVAGLSERETSTALGQFENINTLLAFIAGRPPSGYSTADDWRAFLNVKRAALAGNGYSLCLWESDLKAPPQENALAFAAMLGHTPFALGEPLTFVDAVVGLTHTPDGTLAQVYHGNGAFVGYILSPGEADAAKLLPETFFKDTRVLVQAPDTLPSVLRAALTSQAKTIDATLRFAMIGAGANPNLYAFTGKTVTQPPTGTAFKLSGTEALLASARPAHPKAPVNPLRVEMAHGQPVEEGLRAALAMNTLHPNTRKPRLPVHMHSGDAVKQLLAARIRPAADEGAFMWWM
jgi:hypothetical protein